MADEEGAQVVDPMHLIGMVVGQQRSVDPGGAGGGRLQPQVGRSID